MNPLFYEVAKTKYPTFKHTHLRVAMALESLKCPRHTPNYADWSGRSLVEKPFVPLSLERRTRNGERKRYLISAEDRESISLDGV